MRRAVFDSLVRVQVTVSEAASGVPMTKHRALRAALFGEMRKMRVSRGIFPANANFYAINC
jgi:hypothetical protein